MNVEEKILQSTQVTYIAVEATTRPRGKVPIATQSEPHKRCGVARRIGYTESSHNALALYRLKLSTTRPTLMETLPGYFVLEQGIFQDYYQPEHRNVCNVSL